MGKIIGGLRTELGDLQGALKGKGQEIDLVKAKNAKIIGDLTETNLQLEKSQSKDEFDFKSKLHDQKISLERAEVIIAQSKKQVVYLRWFLAAEWKKDRALNKLRINFLQTKSNESLINSESTHTQKLKGKVISQFMNSGAKNCQAAYEKMARWRSQLINQDKSRKTVLWLMSSSQTSKKAQALAYLREFSRVTGKIETMRALVIKNLMPAQAKKL